MGSIEGTPGKVLSPSKLAHVVLQSSNYERMVKFYLEFLGARITKRSDSIAFLTYDDEHHRIAILNRPDGKDKDQHTNGLVHIAFTFDSLEDLCTAYKQRKALGIEPGWCVVSMTRSLRNYSGVLMIALESWPYDVHVLQRPGWQSIRDSSGQLRYGGGNECIYGGS